MRIEMKLKELLDLYSNLIGSIKKKGSMHRSSHEFSNVHNIIESSLQKIFENFDLNNVCRLNTSHNYFDIYEIKIRGWVSDPETLTPFLYIEGEIDPREDFKYKTQLIIDDVTPDYNKNDFTYSYKDECSFLDFIHSWIPLTNLQKLHLIDKARLMLY